MTGQNFRVRRATVDDLAALKALWESMHIPTDGLEKRLAEFQVAEGDDGKVVGAVGFLILHRHGWIHSEAFSDFSVADQVRPFMWKRIESLAMNHGVARLWTREHAPFWSHNGLQPVDDDAVKRLPEAWDRSAKDWLTLRLKDEDAMASLDKEFDMFVASEKARSAQALAQAQTLKTAATVLVLGLCAALLAWGLYIYLHRAPPPPTSP